MAQATRLIASSELRTCVSDDARETPLADETAALDIGTDNLVVPRQPASNICAKAASCSSGPAARRNKSPGDSPNSKKADTVVSGRLYRKRIRRRDHAQEALSGDLLDRLHAEGVETVYIGGLTDVLETH
ncbi:MAG: putative transposase [Haloquadratum sp. J07HQX50]|nr:MAG: putative transposase [Haloquadratum sp. J07HQX50]